MTQWKIDDELIAQDGNNNEYGGSPYKHFVRSLGKKLFDEIEADSYENGEEMYDAKLKNPIRIVVTKDEDEHRYIIKTVYAAFKLKCTEEYILWVVADYTWVRNGLEFVHLNQGRFVASTARHPDSSVYCENTNDLKEYYNGYMETTDWSMISTYHGSIDGKMTYRVYSPEYQSDLLMLVRGRNKSDKFINIRPIFGNGLAYDPAEPEQIKNNTRCLFEIMEFDGITRDGDDMKVGSFYYLKDLEGRENLCSKCAFVYHKDKLVSVEISDVRRNYANRKYEYISCSVLERGEVVIPAGTRLGGIWAEGNHTIAANTLKFVKEAVIKCDIEDKWKDAKLIEIPQINFDDKLDSETTKKCESIGKEAEICIINGIISRIALPDRFVIGGDDKQNKAEIFADTCNAIEFGKRGTNVYRAKMKSRRGRLSLIARLEMVTDIDLKNPVITMLPYPEAKEMWYQYTTEDEALSVRLPHEEGRPISVEIRSRDSKNGGINILKHLEEPLSRTLCHATKDYSGVLKRIYKDKDKGELWMGHVCRDLIPRPEADDKFSEDLSDMMEQLVYEVRLRQSEMSEASREMVQKHPLLRGLVENGLKISFDNNNIALWEDFARIWIRYRQDADREDGNKASLPQLCFLGEPGTGKTTTARKIAGLFGKELLIATPSDLKGGYVGWTKRELLNLIKTGAEEDKVVLIDEFYEIYSDGFGREAISVLLPILSGDKTSITWEDYKDDKKTPSEKKTLDLKKTPVTIWISGYEQETRKVLSENPGLYRRFKTLTLPTPTVSTIYEKMLGMIKDDSVKDYIEGNEEVSNDIMNFLGWATGKDYSGYFGNYAGALAFAKEIDALKLYCAGVGEEGYPETIRAIIDDHKNELRHQHQAVISIKSGMKFEVTDNCDTQFEDIIGCEEAKKGLKEVSDILANREEYQRRGVRIVKGTLLVGPPGTGKTLLARALAGDIRRKYELSGNKDKRIAFISVVSTELYNSGAVKQLFYQAGSYDTCVIFIDEIDAIGGMRINSSHGDTLIQLLKEMDGFGGDKGIFVLAATNAPETLDPALKRPGRFDRIVKVGIPALEDRRGLLQFYLDKKPEWRRISKEDTEGSDKILDDIAGRTLGYSPAEIENLVNEAELFRENAPCTREGSGDLDAYRWALTELIDREIGGPVQNNRKDRKNKEIIDELLMKTAVHEVGHALIILLDADGDSGEKKPFERISILPRERLLGFVEASQDEEEDLTRKNLISKIRAAMGGRAAEEVLYGEDNISSGARSDISKATSIAEKMVFDYGMSEAIGPMRLREWRGSFLYSEYSYSCSDELRARAENEVARILKEAYQSVIESLRERKELIRKLAEEVCRRENMSGEEFLQVYHDLDKR